MKDEIGAGSAAAILGCSLAVLRRYADSGRLPVASESLGGHRRYYRGDVEALHAELQAERDHRAELKDWRRSELVDEIIRLRGELGYV